MSLASQLEVDEPQLQPACDYCLDQPSTQTAHGKCGFCGLGHCRSCDDTGLVATRVGIDDERESACADCCDVDEPDADRDDGDSYDDRRDDADRYYDNDGR